MIKNAKVIKGGHLRTFAFKNYSPKSGANLD